MSVKSDVILNIVTQYKNLGAAQAESSLGKLQSAATKAGAAIAGVFAFDKLAQFASSSVTAFKNEAAAISLLDNSLKNLGTSYSDLQPLIEKQNAAFTNLGFTDSQTIQAYGKLTTTLGNPIKAMQLMNATADLARYNQIDLASAATLVSRATVGSAKAFTQLGLKVDKNLSPLNAFQKLLTQTQQKIGGTAQAYAQTLAGSLDVAAAKAEHAKAAFGKSLSPAITALATAGTTYLIPVLDLMARNIEPLLALAAALGTVALAIKAVGIASAISAGEMAINPLFAAGAIGVAGVGATKGIWSWVKNIPNDLKNWAFGFAGNAVGVNPSLSSGNKKNAQLSESAKLQKLITEWQKKWGDQVAKDLANSKALTAEQQKQLAIKKAQDILTAAGKLLDVQQAEITAAMMNGQLSQDELDRLKLKQALLDNNATAAGQLANQLYATQIQMLQIAANDPFNPMADAIRTVIQQLQAAQLELAKMAAIPPIPALAQFQSIAASAAALGLPTSMLANAQGNVGTPNFHDTYTPWTDLSAAAAALGLSTAELAAAQGNVTVTINNNTAGTVTVNQDSSTNGTPSTVTRINPLSYSS